MGTSKLRKLNVNSNRAPNRFVQYPIGTRSSEPRTTGIAVAHATCVEVSSISAEMNGISEEISTQTINPAIRLEVCSSKYLALFIPIPPFPFFIVVFHNNMQLKKFMYSVSDKDFPCVL
jgi:ABC-type uncharacterized transport system fused permease/ATPase subunit